MPLGHVSGPHHLLLSPHEGAAQQIGPASIQHHQHKQQYYKLE